MRAKRNLLVRALEGIGLKLGACAGTYFLIADIGGLARPGEDDTAFALRLAREAGVICIPVSAFYDKDPPRNLVRFCFCKSDAVLDEAISRLTRHFAAPFSPLQNKHNRQRFEKSGRMPKKKGPSIRTAPPE